MSELKRTKGTADVWHTLSVQFKADEDLATPDGYDLPADLAHLLRKHFAVATVTVDEVYMFKTGANK